jgi:DNA repair exonuclease SbcCD ATPase subunit
MRKAELEKIENLDQKISAELETLKERRITIAEELKKFGNIPQLREEAETNKKNMLARKQRLAGLTHTHCTYARAHTQHAHTHTHTHTHTRTHTHTHAHARNTHTHVGGMERV